MPVYTHLDTDYAAVRVGAQVKAIRKRQGLTLHELASRVSVSAATLSGIENQKAAPDVALFLALAKALGISIDELLPRITSCHFQITRRAQVEASPPLPMKLVGRGGHSVRSYHNRLCQLAGNFVERYLEPMAIEIEPAGDEDLSFISHNHEEFLFLITGEVECLVKSPDGLIRERLGVGDCMYFWSYLPHCIRSVGTERAFAIDVLCSLDEPADSESGNGSGGPIIYLMEAAPRGVVEHVGSRIASLRVARGMSTSEFAQQLGVSLRRLVRIERGERPIPLDMLLEVCRRFRKPAEYFLATGLVDRPFTHVMRADQIRRTARGARRLPGPVCVAESSSRPLADAFTKRGMHPSYVKLVPHGEPTTRLVEHAGQEFVYVLRGAVTLETTRDQEADTETLYPGDSCLIDSSAAHRFVAARATPYEKPGAEMLIVAWAPAAAA
jgi:transcriptional regulator with XRE-family HTH domain